jgi:membrane-bound lytic murein transglycosylase B
MVAGTLISVVGVAAVTVALVGRYDLNAPVNKAQPSASVPAQAAFPSAEPSATPDATTPQPATTGRPADALQAWSLGLSRVGIPPAALQAYGYAETVLQVVEPKCHLSWTMLAGIGSVESNHGRYAGATLEPDGTSKPRIVGVPLTGASTERITDTDRGALDGDVTYDRAIGAMQFLPSTWRIWAVDADRDGKADPFDIDDAALAAAYYLCDGGRDLATGADWSAAVYSYNNLTTYVRKVYEIADGYGHASG